ncbi:hypothetical protein [Streptomyces aurantiogriseus]|uniref:Uncharacterized protein n=1 Tax=Streptomyces aurantiogriseus TaxID=66870 RepID=A0A918CG53_9ACTN|nr:hypothetical protein [Streptomyces aurantiogriseus]GGR23447.1 hypothetical protein GCM10010251_44400 [Streptomyces aurantiogriseus]
MALLIRSAVSWAMAAYAHRLSRSAVLTILLPLGVLAPVTAAVASAPVLLLASAGVAVFAATSAQTTLSVVAGGAAPGPGHHPAP